MRKYNLHADTKHPIIDTVICILQLVFSGVKWTFTVSDVVPNGMNTMSLGPLFCKKNTSQKFC